MSDNKDLLKYFPFITAVIEDDKEYNNLPGVKEHVLNMLTYNLTKGKLNRGMFFVNSYKILHKSKPVSNIDLKLINIMGWCIEMIQGYFLVFDDIVDKSQTRRNQLCWYRCEKIGLSAINDGLLIQSIMFKVLHYYFRNEVFYTDIINIINDITLKTSIGEFLDSSFSMNPESKVNNNNLKMNETIMTYKTAYYSYVLPVSIALYMNSITDDRVHNKVKEVLLEMGRYFQTQDDYIDCFGDPMVTGKIGTDIQEGKCTWLSATALNIMSSEQHKIMEESYGINDSANVEKIKKLYLQLNLPKLYQTLEEKSYRKIIDMIKNIDEIPEEIFVIELNKLYQRKK